MLGDLLHEAIQELRQELEILDQVIREIEAVDKGKPRRGRRPKILAETSKRAVKRRSRPDKSATEP